MIVGMRPLGMAAAVGCLAAVTVGDVLLGHVAQDAARSAGWAQWQVDWVGPAVALPAVLVAAVAGRWWARRAGRRAAGAPPGP
jgi:hypothetical protein